MAKMFDKEPLFAWLAEHSPVIYGAALSGVIAFLRVTYTGGTTRQKVIEGVLCGALTLAAVSGFALFGLPQEATAFVGGLLGFVGVDKVRALADRFLERRADQ